jgi:hypothetical protein
VDGPQFKIHNAWLVTLKIDILQKTGRTDSFPFTNATAGHPTAEQLGDIQL